MQVTLFCGVVKCISFMTMTVYTGGGGGTPPKLDTGTCGWAGYHFWAGSPTQGTSFYIKSHVGYLFSSFQGIFLKNSIPRRVNFLNFQRHFPFSSSVEYPSRDSIRSTLSTLPLVWPVVLPSRLSLFYSVFNLLTSKNFGNQPSKNT